MCRVDDAFVAQDDVDIVEPIALALQPEMKADAFEEIAAEAEADAQAARIAYDHAQP